jgi:hypothetical protein
VTMIEPGSFKTEFSTGSRIRTARTIDDYDPTVGESRRILASHAGDEAGDPAKAAQAILAVVALSAPPLRLLLGPDALGYTEAKLKAQVAEIEVWRAVTLRTGLPINAAACPELDHMEGFELELSTGKSAVILLLDVARLLHLLFLATERANPPVSGGNEQEVYAAG